MLVINFPDRFIFLNFVKTQGILFWVFQIALASQFFVLICFSHFSLSLSLFFFFPGILLTSVRSLPSPPPLSQGHWAFRELVIPCEPSVVWAVLGETVSGAFVLVLTFSASSSALQSPPLEGANHSFVHQAFYFCSSWIFQFSGCIPGQRLSKLLFNKHCPPNSPSWAGTERLFDKSRSVWRWNSEGKAKLSG